MSFEWTLVYLEAFDTLRNDLVTALVVGHPDFSKEFMLATDT